MTTETNKPTAVEIAREMGQLEIELRDWLNGLKTPDGIADVDKAIKHWAEEVKKLASQVESLAEGSLYPRMANYAKCHDCKDPVHGFHVTDKLWEYVVGGEEIVLCWDCFAERADQKGVEGIMAVGITMPDYHAELVIADAIKAYCEAEQLEPLAQQQGETVPPVKVWVVYLAAPGPMPRAFTDKEAAVEYQLTCGRGNFPVVGVPVHGAQPEPSVPAPPVWPEFGEHQQNKRISTEWLDYTLYIVGDYIGYNMSIWYDDKQIAFKHASSLEDAQILVEGTVRRRRLNQEAERQRQRRVDAAEHEGA